MTGGRQGQRICFLLQVRAVPEYRRRHAAVWPESEQAEMAGLFALDGQAPDQPMAPIPEIFHLD